MGIVMDISATHSALPGQISAQGRFSSTVNNQKAEDGHKLNEKTGSDIASAPSSESHSDNEPATNKDALTQQELREIEVLKARDIEIKAHERAHVAAAGSLAVSGASFSYSRGPDGRRYATSGEVGIDTSKVPGDPQATISKAQQVRRAALAPASPSAQDRSIAVAASAMEQQARVELAGPEKEELTETEKQSSENNKNPGEPQHTNLPAHSQNKPLYSDEVDAGKYLDAFA